MADRNMKVTEALLLLANYLEFLGENRFKVIAYRRAVKSIEQDGRLIRELYESGKLKQLPGVGDAINKKIGEILETGKPVKLEELETKIPEEVVEMLQKLPVSGAKIKTLVKHGIMSIDDLKTAYSSGKLMELDDLGEMSVKRIRNYIDQ